LAAQPPIAPARTLRRGAASSRALARRRQAQDGERRSSGPLAILGDNPPPPRLGRQAPTIELAEHPLHLGRQTALIFSKSARPIVKASSFLPLGTTRRALWPLRLVARFATC